MPDLRRSLFLQSTNLEEINRVMMLLADRMDEMEGRRGTPTFYSAPDVQGNKITNVNQGETSGEALTADLETTDLEITASRLRVKVAETQALQRTTSGIGVKADDTYGLEIDATAGLRTKVMTAGGVAIDESDGLYADESNIDHGSLGGLSDDDHIQYLNTTRHDTPTRHGDAVICQAEYTDYSTTSTIVGWAAAGITKEIYYKKIGKTVFVFYRIEGTSDTTGATFTLPYTAAANPNFFHYAARVKDNGTVSTTPGYARIEAGSDTVTIYRDWTGLIWTNSGDKYVCGTIIFEASS